MNAEVIELAVRRAQAAPKEIGRVLYLINRPEEGVHTPVESLYLDIEKGILGDRWIETAWLKLEDGRPDPCVQVSLTNAEVMECFTGEGFENISLCGDNLYADFNLTEANLPAGSQIQVGNAVIELSDVVNDACAKFAQRFGAEAFRAVRAPAHASLRLRGLFARVVVSGEVRVGDTVNRLLV